MLGYYERFLARFPTLDALAQASPRHVRESWDGLGYYARARNLQRVAREVRELPSEPSALRALPGIGAYTAGAVASFAFERRAALVDTNVARVLRRAFAPRADFKTTRGQRRLWALAESMLPRTGKATWTHNQALMELGALVCTARVAKCGECPVRSLCMTGLLTAVGKSGRKERSERAVGKSGRKKRSEKAVGNGGRKERWEKS